MRSSPATEEECASLLRPLWIDNGIKAITCETPTKRHDCGRRSSAPFLATLLERPNDLAGQPSLAVELVATQDQCRRRSGSYDEALPTYDAPMTHALYLAGRDENGQGRSEEDCRAI